MKFFTNILILMLFFVLFCTTTRGQSLPLKEVITHLIEVEEIASEEKWQDAISNVELSKVFDNSKKGLYIFSDASVHHYSFLLLKSNDTFLILNCNDFIKEYEIMINHFYYDVQDTFNKYLPNIIQQYIHNQNYHKTPPMPILGAQKTKQDKPNYPIRKLINTSIFYYRDLD